MAIAAATKQVSPSFVLNTMSCLMFAQSASVVFDSMNGSKCAWFCAAFRLLNLNYFPFSHVLLLRQILSNILFIIESHKQLPFAEFNFPALKFNPWRKAFDRACLSKFVTILLLVFISCTGKGVALFLVLYR